MIDIKDLQIGDKVRYKDSIVEVAATHLTSHVGILGAFQSMIVSVKCEELEPIEVTDELLLKLGFVFNEYDETYDNIIRVRKEKTNNEYGVFIDCEDYYYADTHAPYFKYLHELQNIYRLITKKDLEIWPSEIDNV